jgi:hypothetical protein
MPDNSAFDLCGISIVFGGAKVYDASVLLDRPATMESQIATLL